MSRFVIPLIAGVFTPVLLAAWVPGSQPPAASQDSGQVLSETAREAQSIKTVCGHCHNLELVLNTPKSYDAWHDTVQKMIDHGAKGTDDQLDDVMDYLHRTITTIDVNSADVDELEIVFNVPETTAQAIVNRRKTRKFTGLADLKSVAGVGGPTVDSRARLIFFN
jgi:hypothetical protein